MLRYAHPQLYFVIQNWPSLIFLPSVLVLIASLALVTRRWDQRDADRAQELSRSAPTGGGATATSSASR